MVKYATALRLGTADTEDILRRFRRSNVQHPVYKALAELGKATKTIFLCRYPHSLELRREIHEGLNVIENWNNVNDFIFFGKGGEMAPNRLDDQKIGMLCLHLIQLSLVYINTLMIQQVLAEPEWSGRLTLHDLRGITPMIYRHVNPYGSFRIDLNSRLQLDPPASARKPPAPNSYSATISSPGDRLPRVTAMLGLPHLERNIQHELLKWAAADAPLAEILTCFLEFQFRLKRPHCTFERIFFTQMFARPDQIYLTRSNCSRSLMRR